MTPSDSPAAPTTAEQLEIWGLARCPLAALARLEPLVEELSKSFTDARPEHYQAYLDTPDVLTAYTLFFAPQTAARTEAALRGILARLPAFPQRPLRVLDLGCGVGSAALGALAPLQEASGHPPTITCVDWSAAALAAAAELLPGCTCVQADLRTYCPTAPYDVILSSFAFNEAFPKSTEAREALTRLTAALATDSPAFLLLLEPASRADTPRFLALRTALPEAPLYAPCPHNRPCPMLATHEGICHDVRRFRPGRAMTLLNRHLYRTIADVKYALLAFGRPGGPAAEGFNDPEFLRITGPMDKAKGLLTCRACMGDGALRRVELPIAALSAERRHALLNRQRGDCAWLDGPLDLRRRLANGTIQRTADLRFTDEPPPTLDDDCADFSFSI